MTRAKSETLVIKVGSALLVENDGRPRRDWLATLVEDIAGLHGAGHNVIIVSSGSIALGALTLGLDKGGRASLADAQAAASVGQIALSRLWSELLAQHEITAAQMLLTLDDMEDRRRYLNATATLETLIEKRAVPVINENDSVATDEIRFGDNDRLAARAAQAASAHRVYLLSDVAGLEDRSSGGDGALIREVEQIDDRIKAMDDGTSTGMGSGGMKSKLDAARLAHAAGIELVILSGRHDHPLQRFAQTGEGTLFRAGGGTTARKAWLGGRLTFAGTITVDNGAVTALRKGSSLLAAGITAIDGNFERSDLVKIADEQGQVIAHGLAEYDAIDCARIIGRRTSELEAMLGYAPRSAVVHRNQMVMV